MLNIVFSSKLKHVSYIYPKENKE